MEKRNEILFPLVLTLLLGTASMYLHKATHLEVTKSALPEGVPEVEVEDFTARRMLPDGKIEAMVKAASTTKMPASQDVVLGNPVIYRQSANGGEWIARSDKAVFESEADRIVMDGGAKFVKKDGKGNEVAELDAPKMVVDSKTGVARAEGASKFRFGSSSGVGNDIVLDPSKGDFKINSGIKATIMPRDIGK